MNTKDHIRLELHSSVQVFGEQHAQPDVEKVNLVVVFKQFPRKLLPNKLIGIEGDKKLSSRESLDHKFSLTKDEIGKLGENSVVIRFGKTEARVSPSQAVFGANPSVWNCGFDLLAFASLRISDDKQTCIGELKSGSIEIYATERDGDLSPLIISGLSLIHISEPTRPY